MKIKSLEEDHNLPLHYFNSCNLLFIVVYRCDEDGELAVEKGRFEGRQIIRIDR